ncbi:M20/M25/M40 family metallo-hydrolase [Parafannyhessea umbonata]|uniref:M20/M25/M40 family metallo-hydrolase n=1 Tax=Parafannyhessea umbonata TaxID=604330 RepID=UPI003F987E6B
MASVWQFFSHEGDYADLNEAAACSRLAQALSITTVDGPTHDETDWAAFDELGEFFRKSFPYVFEAAEVERVDHSLMLTLHGQDASLDPVMFMGHMDVVPVVPGTEGDWEHGAFSGHMDDAYVWGRGALDMKDQVMGVLEAVEYALRHGWEFRRTLMLCLGQDEETLQSGARSMGGLLARRGVRLHFVVDEGDYLVTDLAHLGAPGRHCMTVGLAEKGYADVRLVARSAGGHSSNPYGGTSLARLAKAIDRVASSPWPAELIEVDRTMLAAIAPYVTEGPLARLVAGGRASIDANAQEIADAFRRDPQLFPLVTTTVAPTMIEGSSRQSNVMPQDMSATINFRILPGTTVAQVEERVRELVDGLGVEVELVADVCNDPSNTSRADGAGFAALREAASRYFVEPGDGSPLPLVPSLQTGATDASMYECVCDGCLRFSPFVADAEEVDRGVHGTNERITRRAYMQGIRFFVRLIQQALL